MSADNAVCACSCGEPFDDPTALGEHVATECDGEPLFDDAALEITMSSEETEISIHDYAQIGSHEFATNVETDDGTQTAVVDLFNGTVDTLGPNATELTDDQQSELLYEMTAAVPKTPEQPFTFVKATANAGGGGGSSTGGGGGSADGSGGDDGFDGDIISDPGDTDYDADDLEDQVDEWLNNYANVKSSMIEGAWDTQFRKITDPEDGESELGVYINIDPWHGPLWDHDAGTFDTDDGKQPDEWADHKDAMKSIFSDDDSPVRFVVEEGDPYDTWYNYVPAEEVDDL